MKVFIRVLSLVLALILVSSTFIACGDDTDNPAGTGGENGELRFEGEEYRILGREYQDDMFREFEIDRDEMPEDVVGIAVWNRNEAIRSKYGLDVVGTLETDPGAVAKIALEAGEDQFDLILRSPSWLQPMAMQGYFLNIRTLENIDLTKDCWNDYANTQLTMGGKLYYTTSKFLLHDKHRLGVTFYNRDMAEDLKIGYLEDKVLDGTWTIEDLVNIAKNCSSDKDGIDGMSMNDSWGVTIESAAGGFSRLAFGIGFRISDNGSDGYPQLIGATDQMVTALDKVFELTADKNTCYIFTLRDVSDRPGEAAAGGDRAIFVRGDAVTLIDCMSTIDNTGEMNFAYGVLPMPKLSSDQKDYYSLPDTNNGTLMAVPATVNDAAKAGFGLQKISEESVSTSYNAYIETKCKLQDAYDEDMAKCLDIIFDGVVYDVAYVADIGGMRQLMSDLVNGGMNIYASQFKKKEKKAAAEMKDIKTTYAKHMT